MFIQQEETMETITNWFTTEKEKIVEYQTQAWAEAKIQTANNAQQITEMFEKVVNFFQ